MKTQFTNFSTVSLVILCLMLGINFDHIFLIGLLKIQISPKPLLTIFSVSSCPWLYLCIQQILVGILRGSGLRLDPSPFHLMVQFPIHNYNPSPLFLVKRFIQKCPKTFIVVGLRKKSTSGSFHKLQVMRVQEIIKKSTGKHYLNTQQILYLMHATGVVFLRRN